MQEDKAYFSKVGIIAEHDYDLVFKDYQNLQRLRKKLLKTKGLLGANSEVCKQYQNTELGRCSFALGALDSHALRLETQQRIMCQLLDSAEGVGKTVSNCPLTLPDSW